MHNHEPPDYECPLCLIVDGKDDPNGWTTQPEIVYRSDKVLVWINPRWWPENHGAVVMCPTQHFENIYDLPAELGADLQAVARIIALAMKHCYGCDGISTRQHNEPSGNQEVWHYHLHVFPRYEGDRLYERHSEARRHPVEDRIRFAERLRPVIERFVSETAP